MNDKTLKISDAKIKTMLEEISKYVSATNVVEMAHQIAWLLFESDLNCTYAEIHHLQKLARTEMLFTKEARNCIDVCVDTAFEVVNAVNTFLFCTNDVYEEFSNINSRFNQTYQKDFKNKALILYGLDTFKTRLNDIMVYEYDLSFKDETLKELLKFSIALENPNYAKENTFVRS